MSLSLDHVVLWVADPLRSLEFFESVVGLAPVRVAEFRAGQAPFPSVRVSDVTILDGNVFEARYYGQATGS